MPTLDTLPTSNLFNSAHLALVRGEWSAARALLDELARRSDNRDCLCAAETYRAPAHILALLNDRIELVNSKAGPMPEAHRAVHDAF